MTPLGREIAEAIRSDGPMPLDRYMALALGHPTLGYYATRDPFGARGDFVTAPEISQMFGELIGLWCAEVWSRMGRPGRVALVELGPGRGTLMADILRAARAASGFLDAVEVVLVETSPTLRTVQEETLKGVGVTARWTSTVEEALGPKRHPGRSEAESRDHLQDTAQIDPSAPQSAGSAEPLHCDDDPGSAAYAAVRDDAVLAPAIVVANEFFDALPIRQFVATAQGWRERLVGLGPDDALAFGLAGEPPKGLALPDAPEGAVLETCPQATEIVARLAAHVAAHGGATLAIDYGHASGHGDTLQALAAHAFADPLDNPGEADLTAHVDFSALAAAAASGGASVMRLLSQADLLEGLGLAARVHRLAGGAYPSAREAIFAAAVRLTDRSPRGMGALFKALAFGDPRLGPLPSFEPAA